MLASLKNMFKVPDLRNKILFTLFVIALYRLGSHVPVPGINFQQVRTLETQAKNSGSVLSFLNLFSGGALTRMALFGLGIMPYITSSIIIQLLGVVIPKLEQWRDEGAVGQRKITQATRYLTIVLAIIQSTGLAFVFHGGGNGLFGTGNNFDLFLGANGHNNFTIPRILLVVLSMTAGTAVVMWLGELVTQRGIGQGMSIIIFANVVSTMPSAGSAIYGEHGPGLFSVIILVTLLLLAAIVFIEQGQRRIPVQFAKRVVGKRMYGGQSSYIPLKVNQGGVIPIIFASSVLYFPVLLTNVIPWTGFRDFTNKHLVNATDPIYLLLYGVLIIGFAYFYTAIAFDPAQQADIIRKQGGYIPGIRPGPPTVRHLQGILNRITLPGSVFLAAIALLPSLFINRGQSLKSYPFAGTTILIAVGVALETMKQIDSQLAMRNYEGFLK